VTLRFGLLAHLALLAVVATSARADEAFVTNQSSDDLTIVDLGTMKPVATLPIGGKPAGVAVSRDGSRAYVTSPDGKCLTVLDARERKIAKRLVVNGGPLGVAVAPDGKHVYVAEIFQRKLV
jgi:YVTN family beta-propeller protein